jgi:hypothetical protein
MTSEQLFSLCSTLALAGWICLVFLPRWRPSATLVAPVLIPSLIAILYLWLVATSLPGAEGGFGTLAEVKLLFANERALLAGWIHYLAFDLFIGAWEVRDARRRGIHHLALVPCLLLTFLFGPVGLLLYLAMRAAWKKQVTVDAD